jgi:hypothetical protein
MTPDDRGRLRVLGLEADRYELKETDTDLNYLLLHHPIPVEIRLQTGDCVIASAIADGKESALQPDGTAPDALVTLTVVNKPLVPVIPGTPPPTGGTAAVLYVCIGLCIFALFGLMLLGIPPKKDRHTK